MAVHKPTRVLGKSIALKSAQKTLQARVHRTAYATLNLTAMVDMFTLLTIFLLANFSATGEILFMSKDIELPKAEATAQLERAPVVSISARAISLEGQEVLATGDLTGPDASDTTELTGRLRELRDSQEAQHPGSFKGMVILQCDQDIQFTVVRKIMYAAAEAGYTDVNHAVLKKD